MYKSISWKTAFLIVIGLHITGFIAVSQYSNFRKNLSENSKKVKEKFYQATLNTQNVWPNENLKSAIVSNPPVIETKVKKQEKQIEINLNSFVNYFESFFSSKIENNNPTNKITKNENLSKIKFKTPTQTKIYKPLPSSKHSSKEYFIVNSGNKIVPVRQAEPITVFRSVIIKNINGKEIEYEVEKITRRIESRIVLN